VWRYFSILFLLTALLPALGIADPVAPVKANPSKADLEWVFDIKPDGTDTPRGKIFLVVNGRKILLRRAVVGHYSVVDRVEYESRGIPNAAITACSGWWAGSGEILYVIRRRKQMVVYIRYLDEGISSSPNSSSSDRRLKTIQL
jgi:hypothetical protein